MPKKSNTKSSKKDLNGHHKVRLQDRTTYDGKWKESNRHGFGVCTFANGDKYEGNWKNDQMHGMGKYFFETGDYYEGQWQNDQKEGQGTYNFKDSKCMYEGMW